MLDIIPEKLKNLVPYTPVTEDYKIQLDANEFFASYGETLDYNKIFKSIATNRYPDPYCSNLIKDFCKFCGYDDFLSEKNIAAGNGSDEILSLLVSTFLQKGDLIEALSPDFVMYYFYPGIYEANFRQIPKKANLVVDVDRIIRIINESNAKMLLFSNPCNPTSLGLAKKDVLRLCDETNAHIVCDEAYMDFWESEQSVIFEVTKRNNLSVLKTCSKSIGMAAARVGFLISNEKVISTFKRAKSPYNVNSFSQALLCYFFQNNSFEELISKSKESILYLYKAIVDEKFEFFEKVYETCTNFVYIKSNKSKEIYDFLLEKSIKIRLLAGNHLRITAGSIQENNAVIKALQDFSEEIYKTNAKS